LYQVFALDPLDLPPGPAEHRPGSMSVNPPTKHCIVTGPFSGLWVRTARTLSAAGFTGTDDVRAAITSGRLRPFLSIRGYGTYAHREVLRWLSIR
jgi:hypothetical protein